MGSSGLEPPTSRLSGARSNHLSYEPIKLFSMYLVSLAFVCFALIHSPLSSPSCDVSDFSELPRVRPRRLAAGGDDGIRTHDPLLAGQVLSQLSYTPILFWGFILSVRPRSYLSFGSGTAGGHSKLNNKRGILASVPYLTSRLS